jgi:hypothetical protein
MGEIVKSKYFWIAVVILVPFVAIWIAAGLVAAVFTLVAVAVILGIALGARNRRYRYSGHDDDGITGRDSPGEERGGDIYVHQKRRCPNCNGTGKVDPPPINRVFGIKWTCKRCGGECWIWD